MESHTHKAEKQHTDIIYIHTHTVILLHLNRRNKIKCFL